MACKYQCEKQANELACGPKLEGYLIYTNIFTALFDYRRVYQPGVVRMIDDYLLIKINVVKQLFTTQLFQKEISEVVRSRGLTG